MLGMEDYPRTITEFEARFSQEAACREYLEQIRWPDGFRCPSCGGDSYYRVREVLFQCTRCRRQSSVTAGTLFQDLRKPLTMWFRAMWYVTSQKNGASALGIQRTLGLRSYQTAWLWLHKLRRAMVRPDRDRLSGWIEVDETYFGSLEEGRTGRGNIDKVLIAVAVQAEGPVIGRIRMRLIPDASADSLHPFVQDAVEPGSTVHTDGWLGYSGMQKLGYVHEVTRRGVDAKRASKLMPRVHRVISLLKRWILGTHQGGISAQHLEYYLDEFTFRFNRTNSPAGANSFSGWCSRLLPHPPSHIG